MGLESSEPDIGKVALEPLRYPIYVVCKRLNKFPELLQKHNALPEDLTSIFRKCIEGDDIWGIETYIFLKQRGLEVYLTTNTVPNEICIVPYNYLSIGDFPYRSYVVACRIDGARPEMCERQTVLNELCVNGPKDKFLVQWPQVGLVPRDPSRGSYLKTLAFKGTLNNLDAQFRDADFIRKLESLGIDFEIVPNAPKETLFDCWSNYFNVDAVLAIRRMERYRFEFKPPTKLINAWFSGCPALLGPEPAYRSLRRSSLDYFEIKTPADAIEALHQLKENPKLYTAMIKNGFERAQEFTVDRLCLEWRNFLANSVVPGYEEWLNQSALERKVGRPIKFILQAIRHKQAYRQKDRQDIKVYGFD